MSVDMSRFKKIETDRFMYNPNNIEGETLPLVGYLINVVAMPPIARGKESQEWDCFVVKTTEVTRALDREAKTVEVPVGSEVLIPVTFQLAAHFDRVAGHPKFVFEVMIQPKKKINVGKGQTMWTFDLGANPKGVIRDTFGTSSMLPTGEGVTATAALPAKGQTTAEAASSDDIPF